MKHSPSADTGLRFEGWGAPEVSPNWRISAIKGSFLVLKLTEVLPPLGCPKGSAGVTLPFPVTVMIPGSNPAVFGSLAAHSGGRRVGKYYCSSSLGLKRRIYLILSLLFLGPLPCFPPGFCGRGRQELLQNLLWLMPCRNLVALESPHVKGSDTADDFPLLPLPWLHKIQTCWCCWGAVPAPEMVGIR